MSYKRSNLMDYYDLSLDEIIKLRIQGDTDTDDSSSSSGRQPSPLPPQRQPQRPPPQRSESPQRLLQRPQRQRPESPPCPPQRPPPQRSESPQRLPQRPPPQRQRPESPQRPPPLRPQPIQLQQEPQRPQPEPTNLYDLPLDDAIPIMKARGLLKRKPEDDLASERRRYEKAMSRRNQVPAPPAMDLGGTVTQQRFFRGQRGPIYKVHLREIDPLTHSLDEIIENNKTAPATPVVFSKEEEQSSSISKKRAKAHPTCSTATIDPSRYDKPMVRPDIEFPKNSPYQAVGFLNHKGMIIKMQIGQQANPTSDRSHKWRCMITCGPINVVADSVRKVVAREMAAVEFLQQLRQVEKDCKIPDYTVVDELFISPYIFHFLEKEAIERCLDVQYEVMVRSVVRPDHKHGVSYLFICTYFVGHDSYKGESYRQEYARLAAAKAAYEGLTGKTFLPTKYFTGGNCDPSLEYTFGETEVFQTVPTLDDRGEDYYKETPRDIDEAMRKKARTMLSERFMQSKKDEEEARRNMPVNVQPLYDEYEDIDEEDDDEEDEEDEDGDYY